jgi:hypothetical protein
MTLKPYVQSTKRPSVDCGITEFIQCSSQGEHPRSQFAPSLESAASRVEYNRHIGLLMQQELHFWDEDLTTSNYDSLSEADSDREELYLSGGNMENFASLIQPVALNK